MMKGLRTFFIVFISIVLVFLISFVTFVFTTKRNLEGPILRELVKSTVKTEIDGLNEKQLKEIDRLLEDEETGSIINSILDEYLKYMNGETTEVGGETVDYLFDFIREHKDEIEQITGEEIDLSKIDTEENREKFKENLNKGLEELKKEKNNGIKFAATTYAKITSKAFLIKMLCVIGGLIILIGILSFSLYKWMLPIGIVLIVSGVLSGILLLITCFAGILLNAFSQVGFSLDYKLLLILFLGELVVGIVLVVLQNNLNKKFLNNNN